MIRGALRGAAALIILFSFWGSFFAEIASAEMVSTRYGLGGNFGLSYDPDNDIDFFQLDGFALLDYERAWPHRAPDPLRFKVEGAAGMTTAPQTRAVVSAGFIALYYLDALTTKGLRPYTEAGIGLIYTDFQVDGQGLRLNFNPQAGIGTELDLGAGRRAFVAVRAHHLSNGSLYSENRGINSVVMQAGVMFE